jgi:hypothetical protein
MSVPLLVDKPTIKILLYTDDPNEITQADSLDKFLSLGSMIARLKAHGPAFANLDLHLVSRNSDIGNRADKKIDDVMNKELEETGEPFDQIWFFGIHQANTSTVSLGVFGGGMESELNKKEVSALNEWMKVNPDGSGGGGVLITGDHSNKRPEGTVSGNNSGCPDNSENEDFLGLGRAIGRCVPRAGLLRIWQGAPTYRSEDSFSTIATAGLQTDRVPQQLMLTKVNVAGEPDSAGQPHPLFFYKPGQFIEVFPDHEHEGAVTIPDTLDAAVWPTGKTGQPGPHVVACGTDQRNNTQLKILATYNGDLADVGRIVADSTWHHYMNLNLNGFPHPAPEGSDSDQIGQFYGNLAVWLSPRKKRAEMAHAMCSQLANYTLLLEEPGNVKSIGSAASSILSRVAAPCEIHELILALVPEQYGTLNFQEEVLAASPLPPRELILGFVLDSYHQEILQAESADVLKAQFQQSGIENPVYAGFTRAFEKHADQLQQALGELKIANTNHADNND